VILLCALVATASAQAQGQTTDSTSGAMLTTGPTEPPHKISVDLTKAQIYTILPGEFKFRIKTTITDATKCTGRSVFSIFWHIFVRSFFSLVLTPFEPVANAPPGTACDQLKLRWDATNSFIIFYGQTTTPLTTLSFAKTEDWAVGSIDFTTMQLLIPEATPKFSCKPKATATDPEGTAYVQLEAAPTNFGDPDCAVEFELVRFF